MPDGIRFVIAANDLFSGGAVYLANDDHWTNNLNESLLFTDSEAANRALAPAMMDESRVIGAYVIQVEQICLDRAEQSGLMQSSEAASGIMEETNNVDVCIRPTHYREVIRTTGPTFHVAATLEPNRFAR